MGRNVRAVFFCLCLLFLGSGYVNAQQNAMYSQYVFNTLAYNPAYAGSRNAVSVSALYRNQWVGIEGAPKTATLTADAPFNRERIGLGIQIISDELGITKTTGASLSGAYKITFNNEGRLSFGLQGSVSKFRANFSSLDLDNGAGGSDPVYMQDVNKILYNFGSGVYYSTERFYVGLSALDMLNNRLGADTTSAARQVAHGYFATGYVFPLGDDFNLKTAVLLKGAKGAPVQADLNLTLWIKDVLALGGEYRTSADISASMEMKVTPNVRLGYAYDRSTTSLKSFNKGSHEFMLRYTFSFDQNSALSPRFF
ncbi:type IX secretion system membrane protein PorP/SprF [Daejeonella sp. JGW-45]|uniref:PorP/SprF family type IX secretion system membrane protein n=1 Tax=Daejeonella sp. JGW-45 TaxID=3034148 RepID=UPI0023EBBE11|nr:type IX secretion system membrane protein PorP/SprF [Daejeonella sp. JGW-45]